MTSDTRMGTPKTQIRTLRRKLKAGEFVWCEHGPIQVRTKFQKKRITEATKIAKAYLDKDITTDEIAKMLGVFRQVAERTIRLGMRYMLDEGWIKQKR